MASHDRADQQRSLNAPLNVAVAIDMGDAGLGSTLFAFQVLAPPMQLQTLERLSAIVDDAKRDTKTDKKQLRLFHWALDRARLISTNSMFNAKLKPHLGSASRTPAACLEPAENESTQRDKLRSTYRSRHKRTFSRQATPFAKDTEIHFTPSADLRSISEADERSEEDKRRSFTTGDLPQDFGVPGNVLPLPEPCGEPSEELSDDELSDSCSEDGDADGPTVSAHADPGRDPGETAQNAAVRCNGAASASSTEQAADNAVSLPLLQVTPPQRGSPELQKTDEAESARASLSEVMLQEDRRPDEDLPDAEQPATIAALISQLHRGELQDTPSDDDQDDDDSAPARSFAMRPARPRQPDGARVHPSRIFDADVQAPVRDDVRQDVATGLDQKADSNSVAPAPAATPPSAPRTTPSQSARVRSAMWARIRADGAGSESSSEQA